MMPVSNTHRLVLQLLFEPMSRNRLQTGHDPGGRDIECGCIDPIATEEQGCICLVSDLVQVIGKKYSLRLLMLIGNQAAIRFSEIRGAMEELSSSTLSIRLAELEQAGLIARREYSEIPPRVEYSLTAEGQELRKRLFSLSRFALRRSPPDVP